MRPALNELYGFEYRLELARRLMAVGRTLSQAARAAEMTAKELDVALWNRLGRK